MFDGNQRLGFSHAIAQPADNRHGKTQREHQEHRETPSGRFGLRLEDIRKQRNEKKNKQRGNSAEIVSEI